MKTLLIHKSKGDNYFTPDYVWDDIKKYIPKDKIIWEPFNTINDKKSFSSAIYLQKIGFNVISKPYNKETKENDFFTSNYGDIVVSNPPFSVKRKILNRLFLLDKKFILILPTSTINTKYFKKFSPHTQIIIPKKRIDFIMGENENKKKSHNCFDCFIVCWKMNLERDLIFL